MTTSIILPLDKQTVSWPFRDAPEQYRTLSRLGGYEYAVCLMPPGCTKPVARIWSAGALKARADQHDLPKGRVLIFGFAVDEGMVA